MAIEKIQDNEFQQHLESGELLVVKYYADWCGNCKLIAPKFRKLAEAQEGNAVRFLDINAEENPEARKAAQVTNLPYFAVFKNGELKEGAATSRIQAVEEMLNNHLN
jgi:Thiol-disulfide isomerase and thioredoxins